MNQETFNSRLLACVNLCLCSTGGFAAHVVGALPCQDQQLPLPGGMMHPGTNDQRGEDCGSFPLIIRGKERGYTHSEAMLSSLVHAFCQSSVKTLRRTPVCGSQQPQHDSSSVPTSSPFHLRFLFSVYFLFIIAHPACAVFALPPCLPVFFPFSLFYSWSHLPLPSHGPLRSTGLFSLCVSLLFSLISSASVCHQLR